MPTERTCHSEASDEDARSKIPAPVGKNLKFKRLSNLMFGRGAQALSLSLATLWRATRSCGLRLRRAHKRAHEFSIHLRRERIHIQPFFGEELARVFHAVNARRLNLHLLETSGRELVAILVFFERSCHAPYEQQDVLPSLRIHCPARHPVGNGQPSARLEYAKS